LEFAKHAAEECWWASTFIECFPSDSRVKLPTELLEIDVTACAPTKSDCKKTTGPVRESRYKRAEEGGRGEKRRIKHYKKNIQATMVR
jgi:hypothetical protein